jgi:hypothetical protein
MTLLARLVVMTAYRQVALFDAADRASYPEWRDGGTACAAGSKGLAVGLAGNYEDVPVEVHDRYDAGVSPPKCTATIIVGDRGLLVGNVVADTLAPVLWPAGPVLVHAYVDEVDTVEGGDPGTTSAVVFSLDGRA